MNILDRYVLRRFIEPFLMCLAGFVAIWLIIDVSDNFNDFLEAHARFRTILEYYVTQLPTVILMSLPVGLMLGLLFSLSRMSRTNELISQLTAGRSVVRVLAPLIGVGVLMTGLCLWLNWEYAPHAESIKKDAMQKIKRGKRATDVEPVLAHVFRDRRDNRTWYVRKLIFQPEKEQRMQGVQVTQQDETGHILKKWYASSVYYDAAKQEWKLEKGKIVTFKPDGDVDEQELFLRGFRIINDWAETPWRVASTELNPGGLSVPELHEYLKYNSDFPPVQLAPYRANLADRFALPFECILAVFLAAPLGIVYNRRGVIGGVTAAMVLLVLMIMSHSFFVMLGKGMRMNPNFSPWVPVMGLGAIGMVLMYYRSTNRDFPIPKFFS
jgi:lipopolysaccharide export LptBFGC system permease protein LptF